MTPTQNWITIAIAALVALGGTLGGLYKFLRSIDSSGGDLVARLDKRVEELEDDLDAERKGRADDNERWSKKFDENNERWSRRFDTVTEDVSRLREELAVTRAQKGIS